MVVELDELETLWNDLVDVEGYLGRMMYCGHPECDMGLCTRPLRLVRLMKQQVERHLNQEDSYE